jgi:hypothetical protein
MFVYHSYVYIYIYVYIYVCVHDTYLCCRCFKNNRSYNSWTEFIARMDSYYFLLDFLSQNVDLRVAGWRNYPKNESQDDNDNLDSWCWRNIYIYVYNDSAVGLRRKQSLALRFSRRHCFICVLAFPVASTLATPYNPVWTWIGPVLHSRGAIKGRTSLFGRKCSLH